MTMERIPDHPAIQRMERTGYPEYMYGWIEPEEDEEDEDDE